MDDQQFSQLLEYFGFSWRGYCKVRKGTKKRISRHMNDLNCQNIADYLVELSNNENARQICARLMTVSISRFFRDRKLWEILQNEIIPQLIETQQQINIWVAGCASGEEVYSLKIILEELRRYFTSLPVMNIMATDLNPKFLDRAKAGAYAPSSLKELPEKLRSHYLRYRPKENLYIVKDILKKDIVWQNHNFFTDPLGGKFDFVFLRNNLLTYYNDVSKMSALKKVTDALIDGGFLIIGSHESLPSEYRGLFHTTHLPYVFKKEPAV